MMTAGKQRESCQEGCELPSGMGGRAHGWEGGPMGGREGPWVREPMGVANAVGQWPGGWYK